MKVSYEEDLANHFGLQRRRGIGNVAALSVRAEGNVGQLLSSEILTFACRSHPVREKATSPPPLLARWLVDAAESVNLCMRGHSKRENREIPSACQLKGWHITGVGSGQRTSPRARLT